MFSSRFVDFYFSFFYSVDLIMCGFMSFFFFFKQKTAYEMRISDWSSDVCSSDLTHRRRACTQLGGSLAGKLCVNSSSMSCSRMRTDSLDSFGIDRKSVV